MGLTTQEDLVTARVPVKSVVVQLILQICSGGTLLLTFFRFAAARKVGFHLLFSEATSFSSPGCKNLPFPPLWEDP